MEKQEWTMVAVMSGFLWSNENLLELDCGMVANSVNMIKTTKLYT